MEPDSPTGTPPLRRSAERVLAHRVMDRLARITALFRHRWSAPLLAEIHRLDGAKFVTLVHRTGASGGAVRQTLDDLIARGWVRPNPGYGHPLRPEYILTGPGARIAPACAAFQDAADALGVAGAALRRWSMPVLYAVSPQPRRFNQIAHALAGITDRALALTLRDLTAADLVARRIERRQPLYLPSTGGTTLLPILATL